jgi:hypothetical protein
MDDTFVFVGYQLRKRGAQKFQGTMANHVNPLYIPKEEPWLSVFRSVSSGIPFFFSTEHELDQLIEIYRKNTEEKETLAIFRCAIFKDDIKSAYTEFYNDNEGNHLVRKSFEYAHNIVEPQVEYRALGFDVIATDMGGGFDSAIHTYPLCLTPLNVNGLLDSLDIAIKLRDYAGTEIPEHAPFSVWSIGLVLFTES